MSSSIMCSKHVIEWDVADVSRWLEHHKFFDYVEMFRMHQIDGSVLLSLDEHDLRGPPLSLTTLGHIKKLYSCISQLKHKSSHSSDLTTTANLHSTTSAAWMDIRSDDFRRLKKQLKCELKHSLGVRRKPFRNKSNDRSNAFSNQHIDAFGPAMGSSGNAPNPSFDSSTSELESPDDVSLDDYDRLHEDEAAGFPLPRLPKGEYLQFKPEAWKALVAMLYFFAVTWITAIVMVIVHDRVPDMQTYPPLPDIFLDNVPLIPGAFTMCELCGLILFIITALLLIFHKHRFILIRRMFSLFGSVFLLRCVTMLITSLSVPGRHLDCKARQDGDWFDKLKQAFQIWQGGGMSIQGVRTCGDYMFSGHTVVLTLLNFFITEYTPRSFYFVHTLSWVLNLFGVFFILAGHEHYSIDVFIAFYISTRLFLYYHTLANNRALYQSDRKRTRIWFPLFYFFESGVNGMVPNQFEIPFKDWTWPSWTLRYPLREHSSQSIDSNASDDTSSETSRKKRK